MRVILLVTLCSMFGCAALQTNVRQERGPELSRYEKEMSRRSGIEGQATVQWYLRISAKRVERCRFERVGVFVESKISETHAPGAGLALSSGIVNTLVGGGLLTASALITDAPNTRKIDAAGRYGPSDRQLTQAWSYVFFGLGVPALVLGLVQTLQAGKAVETKRVEEVVGQYEKVCGTQLIEGELVWRDVEMTEVAAAPLDENEQAQFEATQLANQPWESLWFGEDAVLLDEEGREQVNEFRRCLQSPVWQTSKDAFKTMSQEILWAHLRDAKSCQRMWGEMGKEKAQAIEVLLVKVDEKAAEDAPLKQQGQLRRLGDGEWGLSAEGIVFRLVFDAKMTGKNWLKEGARVSVEFFREGEAWRVVRVRPVIGAVQ